jgi:hypothetical protein
VSVLAASIVTAIVTAALAVAGTYVTTRRELQLKFDESLRTLRIDAYKALWKDLDGLAKYGRPKPLTPAEAAAIRDKLRTWYFETGGGLMLSTQTRTDYFRLQDGLELAVADAWDGEARAEAVDEYLRLLGSRLRTGMTADVGTRRTFIFRGDPEGRDARRVHESAFAADSAWIGYAPVPWRRRRLGTRATPLTTPDGYTAEDRGWDPARRTQVVTRGQGEDAEERLLLIDDDVVVEGPKGWERDDERKRRPPVVWRRAPRPDRSTEP